MRILFDHNTPGPLARALRPHEVTFAAELKWHRLRNGALLDAAENTGFDLLLTCDQNYEYQQNLRGRTLAIVILSSNRWPLVKPWLSQIATAVEFARKGQITRIDLRQL